MPSLITGDDKAQMTATFSSGRVEADVSSGGIWKKRDSLDQTETLKLEGARIFNDRYQYGFSLPLQRRTRADAGAAAASGLGDVSAQVGYEYLPDWDYNFWRPRGVGFFSITAPTGQSIYDSPTGNGLEAQGRGFWALGVGTALTKAWTVWDVNSIFEIHRSLEKSVDNSQLQGTVIPGWGGMASLGAGYNLRDWRLGSAIAWSYEDAIEVRGNNSSAGSIQRFATGTLSASYLSNAQWAASVTYSDQTIFGEPINSSLSKSIAFIWQKKWQR